VRVFHFVHAYLYPTENWCYRLIKNLPEDTQVTIVTEALRGPEAFPLPKATFLTPLLARQIAVEFRPLTMAVGLLRLFVNQLWARRVAREGRRADVFHAHFSFMGVGYVELARLLGKPMIVSFYGYDYEWIPKNRPGWKEKYRSLFQRATLFLVEGTAGRDKLIRQGCDAEKIRIMHLGVDVDQIPVHRRTKNENELSLVQVATFTGKKGQATTAAAFIKAAPSCPQMTLTFVGKDPDGLRGPIEATIAEAGLAARVRFIDFIDFAKLHQFLADFQVFVHPSIHTESGDSEGGAPVVLLDAQATGMPILSTRHCDIPEEVVDGATGLLVDEGDSDGLAATMRRFYEMDAAEYTAFARAARAHVEAHYESKQCARVLHGHYQEAIRLAGTVGKRNE
jgi:colanic acid/amylovoran biosynthesis glycosyltransferase